MHKAGISYCCCTQHHVTINSRSTTVEVEWNHSTQQRRRDLL